MLFFRLSWRFTRGKEILGKDSSNEGDARQVGLVSVVHSEKSTADEETGSSIGSENPWELLDSQEEGNHLRYKWCKVEAHIHKHRSYMLLRLPWTYAQCTPCHYSQAEESVDDVVPTEINWTGVRRLEESKESGGWVSGEGRRQDLHHGGSNKTKDQHEDRHQAHV